MAVINNSNGPKYWDPPASAGEVERVLEVCHGCRFWFNLYPPFPALFHALDAGRVNDLCYRCKLCYVIQSAGRQRRRGGVHAQRDLARVPEAELGRDAGARSGRCRVSQAERARECAGKKAFDEMKNAGAETLATDCPLAAIQFDQALGERPIHPIQAPALAYRPGGFPTPVEEESK